MRSNLAEVANSRKTRENARNMSPKNRRTPARGQELIALAQKLARDAERHAILSDSLASQADRLMIAGLRLLDRPRPSGKSPNVQP